MYQTPELTPAVRLDIQTIGNRVIDQRKIFDIDESMATMPEAAFEHEHSFTPGLYSRRIFMPRGSMFRSKIHKTRHQFNVSHGILWCRENLGPTFQINAPYNGITEPGTWRLLYILEDTVWTTYHATDKTTPEEVEADITYGAPELNK